MHFYILAPENVIPKKKPVTCNINKDMILKNDKKIMHGLNYKKTVKLLKIIKAACLN